LTNEKNKKTNLLIATVHAAIAIRSFSNSQNNLTALLAGPVLLISNPDIADYPESVSSTFPPDNVLF
jgi:hypothetical protein